jgi:hypothetical protein
MGGVIIEVENEKHTHIMKKKLSCVQDAPQLRSLLKRSLLMMHDTLVDQPSYPIVFAAVLMGGSSSSSSLATTSSTN